MKAQSFSLQPFSAEELQKRLKITADISRVGSALRIQYCLSGQLAGIEIPPPAERPARKTGLWVDTCFELFLTVPDSTRYWEFNLSPAGHWNVYGFSAYRQAMKEDSAFTSLSFTLRRQLDSVCLVLNLDVNRIVQVGQDLKASIAAVLKGADGRQSFWALTHCGPKPDFHHPGSFIIQLPSPELPLACRAYVDREGNVGGPMSDDT